MAVDRAQVEAWLQPAIDLGGQTTMANIWAAIADGRKQLWVNDRAAAVTEIVDYPLGRVLLVLLAGGDMQGVLDLEKDAAEFGRQRGCSKMQIVGRRGFDRALKHWDFSAIVMERGL